VNIDPSSKAMPYSMIHRRTRRVLAALAVAGVLGGCDTLLQVENPGAILEENLDDPTLINLLVNSVVGEFQDTYTDLAYYGAIITDEAVTGHNFETIQQMDRRVMDPLNGTLNTAIYIPLQKTRFLADSVSSRLRGMLPNPSQDLRLARTLAYAGYSYVLLAEYFCDAPINGSAGKSPNELFQLAGDRFAEAIAIGTAAKAAGGSAAAADEVIDLARVGAARAALNTGDGATASTLAGQVASGFEAWVAHSANASRQYNPFHGHTTGSNHNLGLDDRFRDLGDPRVPHSAKGTLGHNRSTILYKPFQPSSFGEWESGTTVGFERTTDVRFASGLEARYIVAEAAGGTPATLTFVNERRAVGGQGTLVATDPGIIMAELREQRSRDFFMDGHRLGDLRRYISQGVGDPRHAFPSGDHPNPLMGSYEDATCFIVPNSERVGNPNY
jgi:hypothetical protein